MAVYVDSEDIRWKGRVWCHLVADSLDELHSFAARLGLHRNWFQSESFYPHYDVTLSVKARAMILGAKHADRRQIIGCCKQMRAQMQAQKMRQQSLFSSGGIDGTDCQAAGATTVAAGVCTQGQHQLPF
ncbi:MULTISPECIES: DUF4031 domain-containing protein [Pseudomonas syringae group]|uniref:DUF4031 domain-containing protein n=1 Tax=Pseudomonas syringae TaxID=317 RepID=A0AAW4DWL0_PSESX|nr:MULTISPECIES: DUF4031 domain-containing protein [Pseudomonas syringae group]AVI86951.1 hypothetical protein XJ28_26210 [Pseudomonas syringae pv. tomato]MBI6700616.1 DUF4031 domain-containing protein [Pseudomonas syringae]MBI6713525.1 DUF4031 domain-containing protein [Pseudomonas syringae]MBI6738026.1 DUF4031 domain-containing protein [Pseudomonas syringae]MBI6842706.1 DUF4031 domain-containing protein [Pseudomonas syringae]